MNIEWKGEIYPKTLFEEDGYEVFETLIPEPTGDYFHARIDSCGKYECLDFVAELEVKVLIQQ